MSKSKEAILGSSKIVVDFKKHKNYAKNIFMDISTELLQLLLPKFLVDYFIFTTHKKEGKILHLYFEEIKDTPKEYVDLKLHSKGFRKEITIQDFPL